MIGRIQEILGADADGLLYTSVQDDCEREPSSAGTGLHRPRLYCLPTVPHASLVNLAAASQFRPPGKDTGYVSILPVDQGIEHSAGASFAPNPLYFDPENIVKLAIEGGCNAVASHAGRARCCGTKIRAQDSVPDEVQPQRVPLLSERVRSDHVCQHQAGV